MLILLVVLLAACGGSSSPISGDGESTGSQGGGAQETTRPVGQIVAYSGPSSPADEDWVLDSLDGEEPEKRLNVTLAFMIGEEINGNFGCADFGLSHELESEGLRITGEEIGGTNFDCGKPQAVRQQEAEFADVLRNLASLRLTRQNLTLRATDGRTLVFVRPEPPPLDPALKGTEWAMISLKGKPPIEGTRLTLEIGKDNLGGYFGCNGVGGGFEKMAGGKLELSKGDESLIGTSVGCGAERNRQERAYWAALRDASTYRLRGDRLKLGYDAGEATLIYER